MWMSAVEWIVLGMICWVILSLIGGIILGAALKGSSANPPSDPQGRTQNALGTILQSGAARTSDPQGRSDLDAPDHGDGARPGAIEHLRIRRHGEDWDMLATPRPGIGKLAAMTLGGMLIVIFRKDGMDVEPTGRRSHRSLD